jgi:hypothetical protein
MKRKSVFKSEGRIAMRKIISLFLGAVFLAAFALPAQADLLDFGGTVDVAGEEFPLWYKDANMLMLQGCLDDEDFCLAALEEENGEPIIEGLEFFYWLAETQIEFDAVPGAADNQGRARLIMALEGAIDEDEPVVFNEIIIRLRGLQPGGAYTIIHPYGVIENVIAAGVNDNLNAGRIRLEIPPEHPEEDFFIAALEGPIQKFLYSDTLLPLGGNGDFFIGDPQFADELTAAEGHTVFGSPFGTNFFRVEGPGLPGGFIETDFFTVVGKVFFNQNLPPLTRFDVAATKPGEAVLIDVLANDMMQGDVPINPTALEKLNAISTVTGGGNVETVRELDKVLLSYTAPATPGLKTFDYTAETFTGMAGTADVAVFVEDLQVDKAEYRPRTGRWSIGGTSSLRDLVVPFMEDGLSKTAYVTGLTGAQEMPPRTTMASGFFAAIFNQPDPTSFDFLLQVNVPEGTVMNRAHIHLGETGTNGGILFNLCGEPVGDPEVPCAVSPDGIIEVSGTLTADDFKAVGDVTTFSEAVEAIQTGRTYVNVHSVEFPPGEVRGQIGRNVISLRAGENGPAIGAAEVQEDGTWSFSGKSVGSPGGAPHMIHAESALGITETADLRLR